MIHWCCLDYIWYIQNQQHMGMESPVLVPGNSCRVTVRTYPLRTESPRWLVSKGKEAEALRILAYYHADSDE